MSLIIIKNEEQIDGIRKSSKLAGKTLLYAEQFIKEGVSTEFIDNKIDEYIRDHDAVPAPLNYHGYPKSSCISINDVVCHGIPSAETILQNHDIVNIDITTILNGFYGDTSKMYSVGEMSINAKKLVNATKKCLDLGIAQCYPGNFFGNIGFHIANHAHSKGYSVVYEFTGHGTGLEFHEPPQVDHIARRNSGQLMKSGMIFTIEPMINQGKAKVLVDPTDGWTARTKDHKLSAQFEHTILINETGCEVLTDVSDEYPIGKKTK